MIKKEQQRIKMDTKFIGENIYYVRKMVLSQSQEEFAELIGLSKDTVSNYERGRFLPTIENLITISNKTNMPISFFLQERKERENSVIYEIHIRNKNRYHSKRS